MRTLTEDTIGQDYGGCEPLPTPQLPFAVRAGPGEDPAATRRSALLASTVVHEIIPRLMLAHRPQAGRPILATPPERQRVSPEDVSALVRLVLSSDPAATRAWIDALRLRGVSVESIYLDLLAPVARYLGELWEQDLCDFAEVTLGLGQLQQVLRELGPAFGGASGQPASGRRILLLPAPGEQHTFGLTMIAEFFRRAGWDVAGDDLDTGVDPVALVRRGRFDVVGFSLAAEANLEALRQCVRTMRNATVNSGLAILAGGALFARDPERGALVDADAVVADGRMAIEVAERLLARNLPSPGEARGAGRFQQSIRKT